MTRPDNCCNFSRDPMLLIVSDNGRLKRIHFNSQQEKFDRTCQNMFFLAPGLISFLTRGWIGSKAEERAKSSYRFECVFACV